MHRAHSAAPDAFQGLVLLSRDLGQDLVDIQLWTEWTSTDILRRRSKDLKEIKSGKTCVFIYIYTYIYMYVLHFSGYLSIFLSNLT